MEYSYTKKVSGAFSEIVENIKSKLANEGFGILTQIDVQATLKKKLDVEYDRYVILGACNPTFAYKALQAEKEIGLFLPCNVIVYENDSDVYVSAVAPTVAMSMVENFELLEIAKSVEKKLRSAVDAL